MGKTSTMANRQRLVRQPKVRTIFACCIIQHPGRGQHELDVTFATNNYAVLLQQRKISVCAIADVGVVATGKDVHRLGVRVGDDREESFAIAASWADGWGASARAVESGEH